MQHVIVLDDDLSRVDWLRSHLYGRATVRSTNTVAAFLELAEQPHDLAVLDHDLHIFGGDQDLTGMDAARAYEPGPALVWSQNRTAADLMEFTLIRRGVEVAVAPFPRHGESYLTLISAIARLLS